MLRNIAPQDISWFLDLNSRKLLDLNPPYQRHSVWTLKERRYFLDTIFNGYPCPPLFLYKSLSDNGVSTYHVVDGKQRLETIIAFADNKISLSEDMDNTEYAGKKWKGLSVEQRKKFWNYQLAVEMLDTVNSATVKEIFDRYNRTSKNLERQELRHAKFDGWLVRTAEEEAKKNEWRDVGIVTTATARRMKDVQFLSELMIILLKSEISGFNQDELDQFYANYDTPAEDFPDFSEEDFAANFEKIKQWILKVEECGEAITTYGKSATNFYSLWALVALNYDHLPEPTVFSENYKKFMETVNTIIRAETPEDVTDDGSYPLFGQALSYAYNARGANTELPQRSARYEALKSLLLTAGLEHEDQ